MANEKITARVVTSGSSNVPGMLNVTLTWRLTASINGIVEESGAPFDVDPNQTDTEIEASLRTQLADYVSNLVGQTFTSEDIRGCKL